MRSAESGEDTADSAECRIVLVNDWIWDITLWNWVARNDVIQSRRATEGHVAAALRIWLLAAVFRQALHENRDLGVVEMLVVVVTERRLLIKVAQLRDAEHRQAGLRVLLSLEHGAEDLELILEKFIPKEFLELLHHAAWNAFTLANDQALVIEHLNARSKAAILAGVVHNFVREIPVVLPGFWVPEEAQFTGGEVEITCRHDCRRGICSAIGQHHRRERYNGRTRKSARQKRNGKADDVRR